MALSSSVPASCDEDLFDARAHLAAILNFVQSWKGVRSLHLFDFFAGAGMASTVFSGRGYSCEAFDVVTNGQNDVTKEIGFYRALGIILSLVPAALVLLGPPCSLWVFISSSIHRRTPTNATGDITRKCVRAANCLVRNVILLLCIAHFRLCYFILEQPSSSQMIHFPFMRSLCEQLSMPRIVTWMRCFGHLIPKASYLLSNMDGAKALRTIWSKKRSMVRRVSGLAEVFYCFLIRLVGFFLGSRLRPQALKLTFL